MTPHRFVDFVELTAVQSGLIGRKLIEQAVNGLLCVGFGSLKVMDGHWIDC